MLRMEKVRNFAKVGDVVAVPNLIEIQTSRYRKFLQVDVDPRKRKHHGLEALLREVFPIVSYDGNTTLEYLHYELAEPPYSLQECRDLRLTYARPFRIRCRMVRKDKKEMLEENIFLGELPIMIGGGEFIINGAERVIVSQLHRSPGVDFSVEMQESDRPLHGARVIPERGSWIEIAVTKKDVLLMRIDQSTKIPATTFLRALSEDYGTDNAIIRAFYKTKTIRTERLQPHTYLAEAFIDPDTGEEIVPAGGQVGEALTRIVSAPSSRVTGRARQFLSDRLEYAWVVTDEQESDPLQDADLRALETYWMVKYPYENQSWPRLNRKLSFDDSKEGETPAARINKSARLRKLRDKCERVINGKDKGTKWHKPCLIEKDEAEPEKDKLPVKLPNKQGIYFFRDRTCKDPKPALAGGYIGIAGGSKGVTHKLRERLRRHFRIDEGTAGLFRNIKKVLSKQDGPGPATIEVIEDMDDPLILNTLAEDTSDSHDDALLRLYVRLRPGNPPKLDKARTLFHEKFFDVNRYRLGKVGRFRIDRKFKRDTGDGSMTLTTEDFVDILKYIMTLRDGQGVIDDIDHLGNRRLRTIDELAIDEMRKGFLKLRRTVQERMTIKDLDEVAKISELLNSKSVSSSVDFFFGRGELSQVVDQQNPLSMLTHERRLSALGPGGLNRKRAGFETRDVHISHYGRICPIETPEGQNIGLITSLSIYAAVDEYGFVTTPYRKVVSGVVRGEIEFLRADQELECVLAPPDSLERVRGGGYRLASEHVLARVKGDLRLVDGKDVDYVDVSPKQTVGVSASLIPFLEHDDANRALMGSNMQRQAVPLLCCEPPVVATGMERPVAENSGMVVRARKGGTVTYVDCRLIVLDNTEEYELRKFNKLNERACLNQKPIVSEGQRVRRGQILADGSSCSNGELALGRNVLVAFMPFDGYNFEDAIVISERLCKRDVFTSVHLEEYEVEVRETKLGREEFTRDIPNVSERALGNLDEYGIVLIGTRVGPGDVLVGKVSPKSKSELTPEEKLLHAIFGRAGEDVKNDSLELPAGEEGVVVEAKRFSRRAYMSDDLRKDHNRKMREFRKQMNGRMVQVFRDMSDEMNDVLGTPVIDPTTRQKLGASDNNQVILEQIENFRLAWIKTRSPAARQQATAVYDRYWPRIQEIQKEVDRKIDHMKRGDELPAGVLEMVKVRVATKRQLSVGDKMAGRHGNKGVIARIVAEEDMPFLEDGTSVDIILNPLGVPGRMNLGQILETHLGWAAAVLGCQAVTPVFDGATEDEIFECIREAGEHVRRRRDDLEVIRSAGATRELLVEMPEDGKITLYDGRTGEPFEQKVTVGYIYVNKLHHLVDEKIHARATGPYSLITQQPLGGKARTGGQRFGEMEVWGLEAYGASYTLQELLTVKSDDVEGRTKIYESMVKGNNALEAGTPVSFDVLCNELRGLGLNVQMEKRTLI